METARLKDNTAWKQLKQKLGPEVTAEARRVLVSEEEDRLIDRARVESDALERVENAAKTARIGDGKIFVSPVEKVVRIRTGEEDAAAI